MHGGIGLSTLIYALVGLVLIIARVLGNRR